MTTDKNTLTGRTNLIFYTPFVPYWNTWTTEGDFPDEKLKDAYHFNKENPRTYCEYFYFIYNDVIYKLTSEGKRTRIREVTEKEKNKVGHNKS